MSPTGPVVLEAGQAVAPYALGSDLREVVEALLAQRDEIVERWHRRVAEEPFHLGRRARAVADHIPSLVDAILRSLAEDAPEGEMVLSPIQRETVQTAAQRHALGRASQGLSASEVVTELRILRQEVYRALREHLADDARAGDLLAALLALGDALDGALTISVSSVAEAVARETADIISITAHDLKTPLTAIHGYLQLAQRALRGSAEPQVPDEYFHRMFAAVTNMREMIDDVMALAQVSGAGDLRLSPVSLPDLLGEVVQSLGRESRERVAIRVEPGGERPGQWDAMHLRRAFENLLSNALKYAPEGPIRISISRVRQRFEVRISDQGIGLSREDRERLFARFYRSPEAIQRKIEGTGLGLFISRAMIEAHGGSLTLESPGPGNGTTAIVTLPGTARTKQRQRSRPSTSAASPA